jgi:hypothetical protein
MSSLPLVVWDAGETVRTGPSDLGTIKSRRESVGARRGVRIAETCL